MRSRLTQFLLATVFACAAAHSASAALIPLTWDLSAVGLTGAAPFTADALKATEVSHIVFTGPTTFSEHGFAKVTGTTANNVISSPAGLNTAYTLYFDFSITGSLATSQFSTFSFTLYGVNGVSSFGIDGNGDAYVDNGMNVALQLATNSLISGSVAGAPGTDLSAESLSLFSATATGAPVFLSPQLPALFHGAFFHSAQEPGGITLTQTGIIINGGDDTLNFVSPEPSSVILMLGSIPAVFFLRRKLRA